MPFTYVLCLCFSNSVFKEKTLFEKQNKFSKTEKLLLNDPEFIHNLYLAIP